MKYIKLFGCLLVIGVGGFVLVACIRDYIIDLNFPFVAGGGSTAPNGLFTARSLAIIDRPFFGKEHRYYRFELREGPPNNGQYGRILREVTMEPLPGEEFRTPRASPAFPIKWNDDNSAATFSGEGIDLTLRK